MVPEVQVNPYLLADLVVPGGLVVQVFPETQGNLMDPSFLHHPFAPADPENLVYLVNHPCLFHLVDLRDPVLPVPLWQLVHPLTVRTRGLHLYPGIVYWRLELRGVEPLLPKN